MGLDRYIEAQEENYATALKEIKDGYKRTHWMWYIFPQIIGLGQTPMSVYYGIESLEEAKAYLENSYLRGNLIEISQALVDLKNKNILSILGYPDNLKLQSCMTLFNVANPNIDVFIKVLDKYYNGIKDIKTLEILNVKQKQM